MRIIISRITSRCYSRARAFWIKQKMSEDIFESRSNPVLMRLDNDLFRSIFTPELCTLKDIFKQFRFDIRIVGGAVRDILMGKKPVDLDFATVATPNQMKDAFTKMNIRMINDKGEKHGTITVRINDKENFEITTLRTDLLTNGRHAQVLYTRNWKLDAFRRDFTINSMYIDFDGQLYDYYFGYEDLQKRRVAFVGNPDTRIKEDYLRILRYFRFYGRIAENPDAHEDVTITTIKDNIDGLDIISGERIWSELTKILAGNYKKELLLKMLECGIAKHIGLPEELDTQSFEKLCDVSEKNNISFKAITYLAVMLKEANDVTTLQNRLKMSAYERDLAYVLVNTKGMPVKSFKDYISSIFLYNRNKIDFKSQMVEMLKSREQFDLATELEQFIMPKFPISGNSLIGQVREGKQLGLVMKELKNIWLDSNFEMSREKLLKELPRILDDIKNKEKCKRSS